VSYSPAELEVFRRCAFGRCRAAGAEVEDAEDCAQDAVAALLAQTGVLRPKAWVATVAYHRYVDLCRLRQRESTAGLVPQPDTRRPAMAGPEDEVVDRVHARWLVRAMHVLPVTTRAVCLEVAGGGSHRGIAGRLGMTDRAVESHLTRARRSLRGLSLLTAAVVALGRLAHRGSTGKSLAAGLVPSLVLALAVGGGAPSTDVDAGPPPGRTAPDAAPQVATPGRRLPGAAGAHLTTGGSPRVSITVPDTGPDTAPGTGRPSRTRITVSPGALPPLPLPLPPLPDVTLPPVPPPPVPPLPLPPIVVPPQLPPEPPLEPLPGLPPGLPLLAGWPW
jgi:RNA polymerase sigma factor (sigma-70 family)